MIDPDTIETAYVVYSPRRGYRRGDGSWTEAHYEAEPLAREDALALCEGDAKPYGPLWLNTWGEIAVDQL